jgi:hypothetical protein
VHIDGTPGGQLLSTITVFSHAFCTSTFYHPPSWKGVNSQRLHPDEGPPRESTNNPPLHQPSTQNLPTIAEDPEHPTFRDIPEVQLPLPAHISTTEQGPAKTAALLAQTKLVEGLHVSHPRGHLHQYTWHKET